jgi:integrase
MVPLAVDAVARFWSSFRTSRDLAIVGLMLLHGLRSCEVLALNREDVHPREGQRGVRLACRLKSAADFHPPFSR